MKVKNIIRGTYPRGLMVVADMEIGQLATAEYGGKTVWLLRTYDGAVNLNDPSDCWSGRCTVVVKELFAPGTEITLVTE